MTHAEALARVGELRAAEAGVNPVCSYGLLDHGRRVARAVVLIHGFTNCPAMYRELAAHLHAGGANVLVPRLPCHGLADRLTTALTGLSAAGMAETGREAALIAGGLGESVTVAGLSLGGVLAAWLGQFQAGVDRAVVISPLFAAPLAPEWASDLAGFAADRLPNLWLWWDPRLRAASPGPPHAYPRFPTHAYGEMLRLGHEVKRAARRAAPACGDLRVLTNLNDPAVNNAATDRLAAAWRAHGATVSSYRFPRSQGLLHDLVSPDQVYARTAEVYPVLIDWITRELPLAA